MKRKHLSWALLPLLLTLVVTPGATANAAVEPSAAAIDAYVARAMEAKALPGISVVVTHGGKVVHAGGYGHDSAGDPVTERTPMRVASVSKSFTAMAVMTLVDEGRIALDEPVAQQLPDFRMADPRAGRITVRHLLNQTSGLSDGRVDLRAAESATDLASYVAALRSGAVAADPGTRWAYCNANYEVAARLVEVASGVSFGEYLEQRVFGPLGMTDSAVGDQTVKPAKGFNSLFGVWVSRPELRDFEYASGAGGVVTNAADMGQWLISQTGGGTQLVRPESLATMHTASKVRDYGMGWGRETVHGAELLVHSGNLFTYSAVEAIDPATGYGFAVMANSAGLYDDTYEVLTGLVALSQGRTPESPGGQRQLVELALGLIVLAAVGLGVLGTLRSRRWAGRHTGRPAWRIGLRLVPALLPLVLFVLYPELVSFLMNGRTVTWAQVTYAAAPLTLALAVAALAGVVTSVMRLRGLRSVASAR
ncbi:CubicO group peptidase, beta-lactamase class C family [Micromonospora citrea]|uniref:CubicO group peptidase, beta-lactamase class C family n=1 Tax=Micromonospora citrea TaxID=47855 RepID=A0A1C6UZW6_9ACTN|nr:serine hydrolase domain-containing protein [Micromonospora citrea]SCL59549.1 CubicO group peptidase, beta-lactamase class C family [Micromonospora citrea]